MTFKVVTVSNQRPTAWYYLYDHFYESLRRFGVEPLTVRYNLPWGGLSTKPKWLYRAIKDGYIKEDIMIFVDSFDLIFARSIDEMVERYQSFDTDIVCSSELNCFPDDLKVEFDKVHTPTEYKYLNSGCIVGRTEAILTCLEEMDLVNLPDDYYDTEKNCNVHPNDQFEWMKIWAKQPVSITLDYYQSLSQTLHNANINDFEFNKHGVKNLITGAYPSTLHFNGSSKDQMEIREPILKHLNLV